MISNTFHISRLFLQDSKKKKKPKLWFVHPCYLLLGVNYLFFPYLGQSLMDFFGKDWLGMMS